MDVTPEVFAERRRELRQQMAEAQGRLQEARAAVQAAHNTVEAIYGAQQELEQMKRRLLGEPSANGATNRIPEDMHAE